MEYRDNTINRLDSIIELGNRAATELQNFSRNLQRRANSHETYRIIDYRIDMGLYYEFKTSAISFMDRVVGRNKCFYENFLAAMYFEDKPTKQNIESGVGILKALKEDLVSGGLIDIRNIVTSDIFSDFIDRVNYLFENKYFDAAAVIISSVFEQHMRMLYFSNNNIDNKKYIPLSRINDELHKNNLYNLSEYYQIKAWIEIRNKAAHGDHQQYTIEQLSQMIEWVSKFVARKIE